MRRRGDAGRALATVLFTDIVGSTELASELGDERWKQVLATHHGVVRKTLKHFNGREIDTAGDGFFATFARPPSTPRATRCCH
jgi:class 3 adenylate cyclase